MGVNFVWFVGSFSSFLNFYEWLFGRYKGLVLFVLFGWYFGLFGNCYGLFVLFIIGFLMFLGEGG